MKKEDSRQRIRLKERVQTLFGLDNVVMKKAELILNLTILNVNFLLSILPLVTIGPALTALYATIFQLHTVKKIAVTKQYWQAYFKNFKQSIIPGLFFFLLEGIIGYDVYMFYQQTSSFSQLFKWIGTSLFVFLSFVFLYLFPLFSRFSNTTKETIKNATLMSIVHLPQTFLVLLSVLWVPFFLFLNSISFLLICTFLLLLGCSSIAYIQGFIFLKVFQKYSQKGSDTVE